MDHSTHLMLRLRVICEANYIPGNRDSVIRTRDLYQEALDLASIDPNTTLEERAEALTWIMNASLEIGDHPSVQRAAQEGIDLNPAPIYLAVFYANRSVSLRVCGNKPSALDDAQRAVESANKTTNERLKAACQQNLEALSQEGPIQIKDEYLQDQDKLPVVKHNSFILSFSLLFV